MKNDDPQIVIIGAAILDVLVRPADADVFRTGSSPAEEILLSPGGDALNEAAVLSKLGKRVRLETIIGNDRAGRFVISYCEECGIELPGDCIRDGIDTGVNVVLVSEDGERYFLTAPKSTLRRLTTISSVLPAFLYFRKSALQSLRQYSLRQRRRGRLYVRISRSAKGQRQLRILRVRLSMWIICSPMPRRLCF